MKRHILAVLTSVSLLLCFAMAALWVWSNFVPGTLVYTTDGGRHVELATIAGQVRVTIATGWPIERGTWRSFRGQAGAYPILAHRPIYQTWYPLGFAIYEGTALVPTAGNPEADSSIAPPAIPATSVRYRVYAIPFYLPIALTLVLPAWGVIRARRRWLLARQRAAQGLCRRCGYDLRATPERCPECGATVRT